MVSYIHTRSLYDFKIHPATIGYLDSIASRDVRLFIIFIGSIIGLIEYTIYTIIVLAILTHVYVIVKTISIVTNEFIRIK